MLPTVSSSSMGASRRPSKQHSAGNTHRSRPSVTRSHSIFGTLKNIVTAPFTWLATNNEDFAEEKDDQGKRRRVAGSEKTNTIAVGDESRTASDSFGETDEGITRGTKRLRVSSPAGYERYKESQRAGYNDPPQSAFASNAYVPPNRSASVTLPATTIRPTVDTSGGSRYSSTRASSLALQPTMLVDSPTFGQAQPIQRDVSMSGIPSPREHSMDRKTFGIANGPTRAAPPLGRELSLPPTSSRPSFVLRSSLTPQPSQSQLLPLITPSSIRRDTSEPPPISSLRQNPVFVRGPPKTEGVHLPSDSVTLGVLVENHRSSRSPSRSHSLLFPSHGQDLPSQYASNQTASQAHLTPAQKALHALDVYKTPLIPTRLRAGTPTQGLFDVNGLISGSTSGLTGPDLFRRRNPLILMNDRERGGRRKGDRESSKRDKKHKKTREVNETKPYAGAGGMKKLLARARAEDADELRSASNEIPKGESRMSTDKAKQKVEVDEEVQTDDNNVPPLPSSDWYSIASQPTQAGPSLGSSLRVGRSKISRNHIARPAAPIGKRPNKFSAVYEDEVMDGDDDAKDAAAFESDDRRKERIELEEAAKRVPVFNPPPSFSFAKEGPAPVQDNENAEEPPISSLPFSLSKSASDARASQPTAPPVSVFNAQSEALPTPAPSAFSFAPAPKAATTVPATTTHAADPQGFSFKSSEAADEAKPDQSKSGIPNFFATSSILSKPATPPAPTSFSFGSPSGEASTSKLAPAPATATPTPSFSLAPGFSFSKPEGSQASFSFGKPESSQAAIPSTPAPASNPASNPFFAPAAPAPLESKETASGGTNSAPAPAPAASSLFGSTSASSSSTPFSFSKPTESNETPKAPAFSFGPAPSNADKKDSAPTPSLFGSSTPFTASNTTTETSAATKPPLTFPAPAEAPKSLFGNTAPSSTSLFSFGPSTESKSAAPTVSTAPPAFSFSSAPSTPVAEEKKSAFSFNATPSVAPVSGFSFNSSGSAGSDVSSKPFAFSSIARPSTPPKPANDEQEMRMEESPTRESMQPNRDLPKPTLNFSFASSNTSGSTLFGGNSTASSPFSFGPPSTSNPFGAKPDNSVKPAEAAKSPFSFGASNNVNPPAAPFSFGPSTSNDGSRPNTAGPFSFNNSSAPPSATGPAPFSFGAPPSSTPANNPFSSANGSAPNSPSVFSQTPAFSFGANPGSTNTSAATSPAQPFSFGGSQPASPAAPASSLPIASGFGNAQTSTPFGVSAPGGGGQPLFTMGAPPANNTPSGARQIKKLPTRRGGKR
ncbi:hypothetical protein CCMSSC00406_0008691 [Pleurotus cornucopiae]|uniref:Uncharacterized protein n=1 Tax=Pleurotus cornucopiae TaxID=5321 RepID=A0ACB7J898_PLECO|nr:hypothetical protein CCMSSC00406_0008691 [Pleurotus cornucopiae]